MVLLVVLLLQEPRELVETLRSGSVEEREVATRKLRELGKSAAPELEKAANDADPEVAGRARFLLRRIEVLDLMTPRLRTVLPGIEDRLARAADHGWTEAFLEAAGRPELRREDLALLAGRALRGARDGEERAAVCAKAADRRLRGLIPDVVVLMTDAEPGVRQAAVEALRQLDAREAVPGVAKLLGHESPGVRGLAVDALMHLGAREEGAAVAALLSDREPHVRWHAAQACGVLRITASAPRLAALLEDALPAVRSASALSLGQMRATVSLEKALGDKEARVRRSAVEALGMMGGPEARRAAARAVGDGAPEVRKAALDALARIGTRDSLATISGALKDPDPSVRRRRCRASRSSGAGRGLTR